MAYSPASNLTTTGTITHLATVYYNKRALDVLRKMLHFQEATEPDILPLRAGKTIQFYRYGTFSANTTPSSEGTVGVGLSLTTSTVSATISEYSDFLSISSLLQETAIDPIVENATDELSYRAALSVDTIIRTEINSTTTPEIGTLGASVSAQDFARAVALLKAVDVMPKMGNEFFGIMHPYVEYDLLADNTAGGFIDQSRYFQPDAMATGEVGKVRGVRLASTTNVKTEGTAPNVLYHTYVFGKGGVGAIDLAGRGPSKVRDPKKQSFKINVIPGGPSQADPEGMIGTYLSYRYVFVTKLLDTTNYRYRIIKVDATLV